MFRIYPFVNVISLAITTITVQSYTTTTFDEIIHINSTNHASVISCSLGANCHVNSYGHLSSPAITLNATEANNLYLNCYGENSCAYASMKVYGPKDGDLMITCNSSNVTDTSTKDGACENMKVYANNAANVNIICAAGHDCWNTYFQLASAKHVNVEFNGNSGQNSVIHTENVSSSLNIICNDWHACYYSKLYCPLSHTNTTCNVNCSLDQSCGYMKYFIESEEYENLNLQCADNEWQLCFDVMAVTTGGGMTRIDLYGWIMCTEWIGSRLVYEYNDNYKTLTCDYNLIGTAECCPFTYGPTTTTTLLPTTTTATTMEQITSNSSSNNITTTMSTTEEVDNAISTITTTDNEFENINDTITTTDGNGVGLRQGGTLLVLYSSFYLQLLLL